MLGKLTKDISTTVLMILRPVPTRVNALSFSMKERIIFPHSLFFVNLHFIGNIHFQYVYVFIDNIVERTLDSRAGVYS